MYFSFQIQVHLLDQSLEKPWRLEGFLNMAQKKIDSEHQNHECGWHFLCITFELVVLYAKKNGSCFVNKVTGFQMDDMRPDLIERVRSMTSIRSINHLWKQMSD